MVHFMSWSCSLPFHGVRGSPYSTDPAVKLSWKQFPRSLEEACLKATRSHQPVLKCGLRNAAPLSDVSHSAS